MGVVVPTAIVAQASSTTVEHSILRFLFRVRQRGQSLGILVTLGTGRLGPDTGY